MSDVVQPHRYLNEISYFEGLSLAKTNTKTHNRVSWGLGGCLREARGRVGGCRSEASDRPVAPIFRPLALLAPQHNYRRYENTKGNYLQKIWWVAYYKQRFDEYVILIRLNHRVKI